MGILGERGLGEGLGGRGYRWPNYALLNILANFSNHLILYFRNAGERLTDPLGQPWFQQPPKHQFSPCQTISMGSGLGLGRAVVAPEKRRAVAARRMEERCMVARFPWV